MVVMHGISEMRNWSILLRKSGKKIGFVPTMGYLHKGHLEMLRAAREECDIVVVSIFVNPMQFGPQEDFEAYPRDLGRDMSLLQTVNIDALFLPDAKEMYPPGFQTEVRVKDLSEGMCGPFRPGHFAGVATVVLKLLNIVLPDAAWFGKKDYQQLRVLQQMVEDLNLDIKIVPFDTVRDTDGVAISSRNVYLDDWEREQAAVLPRALERAEAMVAEGQRDVPAILQEMTRMIQEAIPRARIDYIEIRDAGTLQELQKAQGQMVAALAVHVGKARLIDNRLIEVPG